MTNIEKVGCTFLHTQFLSRKKKHTNGDLKCKFQNFYQFNFQTKRHPFGKLTGKASFLFSTSKLWWSLIANMSCNFKNSARSAEKFWYFLSQKYLRPNHDLKKKKTKVNLKLVLVLDVSGIYKHWLYTFWSKNLEYLKVKCSKFRALQKYAGINVLLGGKFEEKVRSYHDFLSVSNVPFIK